MKNRLLSCLLLTIAFALLLSSCNSAGSKIEIKLNMTENYDDSDPFVAERLIYVSEDMDSLDLGQRRTKGGSRQVDGFSRGARKKTQG